MSLSQAVTQWQELLGTENASNDERVLQRLARSTLPWSTRPVAVLRPGNAAEVRGIVEIASRFSIPLYPISRGKNWGYGDACAVRDGQAIVDLSRMNRIHHVDGVLGYAVIEPGVTQGELARHLEGLRIPFWLDVTGAGPEASIVGNTIERGFGHTPYGDHFHTSAGYEIVLADGRTFTTGFGHYDQSKAAYLFKPGLGPAMDGLFSQSNLGIVTKMGVWLLPQPEYVQGFAFSVPHYEDLATVVDILRPLRMTGLLPSAVHVANDLRVLSARQRYPWERTGGVTPLPEELRKELREKASLGAWNVLGAFYGTRASVAASRKALRKAMRGVATVRIFDARTIRLVDWVCGIAGKVGMGGYLRELANAIRPVYELLQGRPSMEHLAGAGWRSRRDPMPGNPDPLDNDCGLYWLSPVVPMTGKAALDVLGIMEPIFKKYRFEPLVTMTSITPRVLCCVTTVAFDKESGEESSRASQCYDELFDAVMRAGYVPYRVGIQSMPKLGKYSDTYFDVLRQLKGTLDPKGILAPGRYLPEATGSAGTTSGSAADGSG